MSIEQTGKTYDNPPSTSLTMTIPSDSDNERETVQIKSVTFISVEEKRSQLKFMIDLIDNEQEIWDQEIVPKLPDFKESLLKHGKVLNALNYNIEQLDAMLKLQIVPGPHRVSTSFHNALIEPERMRELFNQTSLYHARLMREEMSKMVPLEYNKAISKHLDMALELEMTVLTNILQ